MRTNKVKQRLQKKLIQRQEIKDLIPEVNESDIAQQALNRFLDMEPVNESQRQEILRLLYDNLIFFTELRNHGKIPGIMSDPKVNNEALSLVYSIKEKALVSKADTAKKIIKYVDKNWKPLINVIEGYKTLLMMCLLENKPNCAADLYLSTPIREHAKFPELLKAIIKLDKINDKSFDKFLQLLQRSNINPDTGTKKVDLDKLFPGIVPEKDTFDHFYEEFTPLMTACLLGKTDKVRILKKYGADINAAMLEKENMVVHTTIRLILTRTLNDSEEIKKLLHNKSTEINKLLDIVLEDHNIKTRWLLEGLVYYIAANDPTMVKAITMSKPSNSSLKADQGIVNRIMDEIVKYVDSDALLEYGMIVFSPVYSAQTQNLLLDFIVKLYMEVKLHKLKINDVDEILGSKNTKPEPKPDLKLEATTQNKEKSEPAESKSESKAKKVPSVKFELKEVIEDSIDLLLLNYIRTATEENLAKIHKFIEQTPEAKHHVLVRLLENKLEQVEGEDIVINVFMRDPKFIHEFFVMRKKINETYLKQEKASYDQPLESIGIFEVESTKLKNKFFVKISDKLLKQLSPDHTAFINKAKELVKHCQFIPASSKNESGIKSYQDIIKLKLAKEDMCLLTNKRYLDNNGNVLIIFDQLKTHSSLETYLKKSHPKLITENLSTIMQAKGEFVPYVKSLEKPILYSSSNDMYDDHGTKAIELAGNCNNLSEEGV